jgi:hypothetical protein
VQAFADFSGSQPWPLQEFCPLHALLAVLQDDVPLHVLIPMQWTPADLALDGATETPLIASAMAATAMLLPDTIFIFMFKLPQTAPAHGRLRASLAHVLFVGGMGSVTSIQATGAEPYNHYGEEGANGCSLLRKKIQPAQHSLTLAKHDKFCGLLRVTDL